MVYEVCKSNSIAVKSICIMITVVNKHYHMPTPNDIYCGRGSKLGNMYSHMPGTKAEFIVESRDVAIDKYEEWLLQQLANKNPVICRSMNYIFFKARYGNVNLVCYCAPKKCHCDVIKRVIEEKIPV